MANRSDIEAMELYAWVGWDEYGSGKLGLKQGVVPAGTIPMAAIDRYKLENHWPQAEDTSLAIRQTHLPGQVSGRRDRT